MATGADHEGLASASCHDSCPVRQCQSQFFEVGEFADFVSFHVGLALA